MAALSAAAAAAAPTVVITGARISSSLHPSPLCSLLLPPRRRYLHASTHFSDARRFSTLRVRADSSEDTSSLVDLSDLKEKWDAIENKSAVFLYVGGAIVAVWLSSVLVEAIDSVPLVPKFMEVVGLGYTGWFVYRYLLYKSGRKELADEIEDLKKKIAGTGE